MNTEYFGARKKSAARMNRRFTLRLDCLLSLRNLGKTGGKLKQRWRKRFRQFKKLIGKEKKLNCSAGPRLISPMMAAWIILMTYSGSLMLLLRLSTVVLNRTKKH